MSNLIELAIEAITGLVMAAFWFCVLGIPITALLVMVAMLVGVLSGCDFTCQQTFLDTLR